MHCIKKIIANFAASEGRNPWVKNAFLALFPCYGIANFQRRDEDESTFILSFAYMQESVQLRLYTFLDYMRQREVFVSSVHFLDGVWRYQ